MENYNKLFRNIIDVLASNSKIVINEKKIGDLENDLDWKMMLTGTDLEHVTFPQSYTSLLDTINGLKLDWCLVPEATIKYYEEGFPDAISGNITIFEPSELIGKHIMGVWEDTLAHHSEENSPDERAIIIPFDYYFPDYSECACFKIKGNRVEENIVFHSSQYGFYYSHISLPEYLDILLETRGLALCREAIIFPDSTERDKVLFYTEQLFPNTNIRNLLNNLDKKIDVNFKNR